MPYPQIFLDTLKFALQWEGGYSNIKGDLGGATNYGITQSTYNEFRLSNNLPTNDIKKISMPEVEQIYFDRFWNRAGCPHIVSPKVAMVIADFVINSGFASKSGYGGMQIIQRIFKVTPDGISGTATQSAINSMINLHGESFVCKLINDAREKNFERLGKSPSQKQFLGGWLNRVHDLSKVIGV